MHMHKTAIESERRELLERIENGFHLLAAKPGRPGACIFLALYAFTIFGYVTAALATYFVGRDADSEEAEVAGSQCHPRTEMGNCRVARRIAELAQSRRHPLRKFGNRKNQDTEYNREN